MRLAFLAWTSLEPADSGYRVRARAIVEHLPVDDLLVISPRPKIEGMHHVLVPWPWTTSFRLPFNSEILLYEGPTAARRQTVKALERFKPDVVWCEGLWSLPPAENYRRQTGTPIVLDVQNIECIAAERHGKPTVKSCILERLEQRAYLQPDVLVVCSSTDADRVRARLEITSKDILVLPNGVRRFQVATEGEVDFEFAPEEKILLFLGKGDYGPNREAIYWILRELVPRLEAIKCRIGVVIVGMSESEVPSRPPNPRNVRLYFVGKAPRVEPYLDRADICLAPIFSGSGTRIKVLEFLAAGKPVVATSKAVEGLDLEPGRHFELADDAIRMTGRIAQLLDSPQRAQTVASQGRAFVEEHYRWDKLVKDFYGELESVLREKQTTV